MEETSTSPCTPAPLLRRLIAAVYDGLMLIAVLMLAAVPYVVAIGAQPSAFARHLFQLYLLGVCFVFFAWFWVHGGQTTGMRAWRLRVVTDTGGALTWKQAFMRFGFALVSLAPAGLGILWILVDKDRRAWHDRWSRTRVCVEPPRPRVAAGTGTR